MFLTPAIRLIFAIKLSAFGCMLYVNLVNYTVVQSRGCMHLVCTLLIRGVHVRGNMNSMDSKFKKYLQKNVRDIFFYLSLPHVINRDIFIISMCPLEPHVINRGPLYRNAIDDFSCGLLICNKTFA